MLNPTSGPLERLGQPCTKIKVWNFQIFALFPTDPEHSSCFLLGKLSPWLIIMSCRGGGGGGGVKSEGGEEDIGTLYFIRY